MTTENKAQSKAIRNLIQYAEKGILRAQYQLYENYSKGKYVEKDEILSQKYFHLLENELIHKNLHLTSLQLSEFRRFRNLDITFNERITVIIGNNGAGKTSILEAISKVFTWFNNNLEREDVNGKPINLTDINVNAVDYAEITSKFRLDEKNGFDVSLARTVQGYEGSQSSEVNIVKQFGSIYRKTAKNSSIMIPLLAFYSVERSDFKLSQTVDEKASDDVTSNRFSALKDALDGSGKLDDFSNLYIELVNLADGENTKEEKELRETISNLQSVLHDVYGEHQPPKGDLFSVRLEALREKLASLMQSTSSTNYKRHLAFVNRAIETLVPDVKNLEVDRSSGKPRLLVENFGNKVNIAQLSQGQKMLVALTGDLARRLVTLNPEADNPLHGHGIVLIDEIELHLHPKWQQEILLGLQATFPNLQIIVTTHSPQILSTVDYKCIRQICLDEEGLSTIEIPNFQTKGVTSADILARIMGTNSVPENLLEASWLNEFSRYLQSENKVDLDLTLKKIKNHFGEQHPVVVDCESQIRIAEMKARLKKE